MRSVGARPVEQPQAPLDAVVLAASPGRQHRVDQNLRRALMFAGYEVVAVVMSGARPIFAGEKMHHGLTLAQRVIGPKAKQVRGDQRMQIGLANAASRQTRTRGSTHLPMVEVPLRKRSTPSHLPTE